MGSPVSSPQFQGYTENYESPMSYSKGTSTTLSKSTTWRSPAGAPYGSRNAGSTLNFDDSNESDSPIPKSDKGVGRNEE